MNEITLQDADQVGGGFSILSWLASQALSAGAHWLWGAAISGQLDYSSIAESQGHYYNMTGA